MSFTNPDDYTVLEALDSERLHLILFPTEHCNFRCTYCYEDFRVGLMRPDIVSGVEAFLANRLPLLKALQLSWFGGEPLLGKRVIYQICSTLQRLAVGRQVEISANITTNGSLLDLKTFEKLNSFWVNRYQISLDGDCELHNSTRRSISGEQTFWTIWSNLLRIRDSTSWSAEVVLRVHFSPDSWEDLTPLIDRINGAFSRDRRFKVYFKSIERLGGPRDHQLRTFTEAAKREVIASLTNQLADSSMAFRLSDGRPYVCYAAKANSLAIRADGTINKCTVALSDPMNRVGSLQSDGSVKIDNPLWRSWLTGLESLDLATLACPYSRMQTRIKDDRVREEISPFQIVV